MAIGTTAALIGLGIAGGTKVASSIIGSKASSSAAKTQVEGAAKATDLAQSAAATAAGGFDDAATSAANSIYKNAGLTDEQLAKIPDTVKAQLAPYLKLGEAGTKDLTGLIEGGDLNKQFAFDPKDIENTPGYQFTFSQGMEAIKRAASAQGKSLGGGTLKSLTMYGQDAAKTVYGQEFQRSLDTFNTNKDMTRLKLNALLDSTRMGQVAASDVANTEEAIGVARSSNLTNANRAGAGITLDAARYRGDKMTDAARAAAGYATDAASATSAGQIGSAKAWQEGIGGIGEDVGNYMTYKDLMRPKVSAGTTTPPYVPSYADTTALFGAPTKSAAPPVNYAPPMPKQIDAYDYDTYR